jgi:hypothetical protein
VFKNSVIPHPHALRGFETYRFFSLTFLRDREEPDGAGERRGNLDHEPSREAEVAKPSGSHEDPRQLARLDLDDFVRGIVCSVMTAQPTAENRASTLHGGQDRRMPGHG